MITTADVDRLTPTEQRLIKNGWPMALAKSACDNFDYALMLRTGAVIYFSESTPTGPNDEWALLEVAHVTHGESWGRSDSDYLGAEPNFERGLEVRVADILWVADAPYGS